jgi:hypothetical protein
MRRRELEILQEQALRQQRESEAMAREIEEQKQQA